MTISCAILAPINGNLSLDDKINSFTGSSNYFLVMLSLVLVIFLVYITTRLLSRTKLGGQGSNNIQVIERLFLSSDKMLIIIKIGDEYLLLSQDKTGIKLMRKLENFTPMDKEAGMKFSDVLGKIKMNKGN